MGTGDNGQSMENATERAASESGKKLENATTRNLKTMEITVLAQMLKLCLDAIPSRALVRLSASITSHSISCWTVHFYMCPI